MSEVRTRAVLRDQRQAFYGRICNTGILECAIQSAEFRRDLRYTLLVILLAVLQKSQYCRGYLRMFITYFDLFQKVKSETGVMKPNK